MDKLYIICVDDQREVLNALMDDLKVFKPQIKMEACESAAEAFELIEEIDSRADHIAVVISDHVMPGETGVDLLARIKEDGRFRHTQKILLTGLATHQDTIRAINSGGIDHYFEKPWKVEKLRDVVKKLLTRYVLTVGLEYSALMPQMDQQELLDYLHRRAGN